MANVIKHKRGSGSDPGASDLVVGEVAIRTDVGKLFTKMDNGSVAEIAGGGSDIAINTLSSSSATGGGSATFNGSAYRFTLSSPPSVSAQQLLVSINGVIQKPVAGTGQPSEGFAVDGTDIILGDAPATGADFFILTFKSLGVSEPADNSVTSAKIADGAIVNADVNASAAIAGSKISPDFTSNLTVSANSAIATISATNASNTSVSTLLYKNRDGNSNLRDIASIEGESTGNGGYGALAFHTAFNNSLVEQMRIGSNGSVSIGKTSNQGKGIEIYQASDAALRIQNSTTGTGSTDGVLLEASGSDFLAFNYESGNLRLGTAGTERMRIDSSGRVGIGTTSPSEVLHVVQSGTTPAEFRLENDEGYLLLRTDNNLATYGAEQHLFHNRANSSEYMRIDSSGNVGIGTTSPTGFIHIEGSSNGTETYGRFSTGSANGDQNLYIQSGSSRDHMALQVKTGAGANDDLSLNPSGGNVGIGTTSPAQIFHVKNTGAHTTWRIENDNADFLIQAGDAGADGLHFYDFDNSAYRMTIANSGNVGIGTTSPSVKTQISVADTTAYSASTISANQFQLSITNTGAAGVAGILLATEPSSGNGGHCGIRALSTGNGDSALTISTRGSSTSAERLRIDSSGRLLAGSTSTANNGRIQGFIGHGSTAGESGITSVDTTSMAAGVGGEISFYGKTSSSGYNYLGHVRGIKENGTDTNTACALTFHTRPTLTAPQERMRINSAGNVGIGGTAPNYQLHCTTSIGVGSHGFAQQLSITNNKIQSLVLGTGYTNMTINALGGLVGIGTGTTTLAARLHVENGGSGNVAFLKHASSGIAVTLKLQNNRATGSLAGEQISFCDETGTQRGKITNTTASTTYATSSDYRLKENETPISDGIERVKQLKPYKFNWKHIPNKIVDGFFAHEVENLVEDCVDGTKDKVVTKEDHDKGDYTDKEIGTEIHQMMDHSKLVPLLTAALQEAIGRIEALEAG
ncbi:endosialidase [uncultured Mediterranean phage MEDS1 group]|nr:endosialidase [uncultured Mediterranean phage MEDS1 group]BAR21579.1 endosialidase [uncultured Mediterranean phage uvMED]